jgi:hypothetical protein
MGESIPNRMARFINFIDDLPCPRFRYARPDGTESLRLLRRRGGRDSGSNLNPAFEPCIGKVLKK